MVTVGIAGLYCRTMSEPTFSEQIPSVRFDDPVLRLYVAIAACYTSRQSDGYLRGDRGCVRDSDSYDPSTL
jgi:hypothetical protein